MAGYRSRRLLRSLEFDPAALEDLAWWVEHDRSQALKIIRLVKEVHRDPFAGLGKPEPLKHELAGCWRGESTRSIGSSIRFCQLRLDCSRVGSTTDEHHIWPPALWRAFHDGVRHN